MAMAERYPQWKVDLFRNRNADRCTCRLSIPGVVADRNRASCPEHGWEGDDDATEGRSAVELDAIRAEHVAPPRFQNDRKDDHA